MIRRDAAVGCLLLLCSAGGCFNFSSRPVPPGDAWTDGSEADGDAAPDPDAREDGDAAPDGLTDGEGEGECVPDCGGKECGDDGCGGTCGACEEPFYCTSDGRCVCVPECEGKACGSGDGCGGTCRCLLDGSFVEPAQWSGRESFRAMLREMREFDMSTVIIRSVRTVDCTASDCSASPILTDDELGLALDDVEDAGMKAVVGLVDCRSSTATPWWGNPVLVDGCLDETGDLVGVIRERFVSHRALEGFYLPPTVRMGMDIDELRAANDFYMQAVSLVRDELGDDYFVAGMVYFIASNNAVPGAVTAAELEAAVGEFMGHGSIPSCNLSRLILRDGAGEYKNSLWSSPDLGDYLDAAKNAASPIQVWSALELYQWSAAGTTEPADQYFHPASISRVRRQISLAGEAKRRAALSYPYHMASEGVIHREEGASLHRGYDALYFGGTFEEGPVYSYDPVPGEYPDDGNVMLFDDRTGEEERAVDWVGWLRGSGSVVGIDVDLGVLRTIADVTATFRSETGNNCYFPVEAAVYTSQSGEAGDFDLMGSLAVGYTEDDVYGQVVARISDPSGVQARYVQLRITLRAQRMMLSEVEIY